MRMSDRDFLLLADYIEEKFGVHLVKEKKMLLETRLQKVLQALQLADWASYYQYLLQDQTGGADSSLADAITTNHTFFMREAEHFRYYAQRVLPELSQTIGDGDLRTWCAACSSGEEAYTLAMVIWEFFGVRLGAWNTKLLATDISRAVLEKARSGVYEADSAAVLPEIWRRRYFVRSGKTHLAVTEALKSEIIFRQFNLINAVFPFKKRFHTIFCRNVMIYFDLATRRELARKFCHHLETGGYLFVGLSETIELQNLPLRRMAPSVYRKE